MINLTNHAYFNLNGNESVKGQLLQIAADQILETDEQLIPTGDYLEVANTAINYLTQKPVGKSNFGGLDTVFVLKDATPQTVMKSPETGIEMQLSTNQKAVVVFTPPKFIGIDLAQPTKANFPAICFETQNFPDAPNQPDFPSTVLLPGETYLNRTVYKFIVV